MSQLVPHRHQRVNGKVDANYRALRLLRMAPIQRTPKGYRFGTASIADHVIDRLIADARATAIGNQVHIRDRSNAR